VIEKARSVQAEHDASVARAIEAGVKVAMGTDSGVGPHGDNLSELGLMADCGMTPEQAWLATTLSAAELLGVAGELGSVEPGKRADVVVLDGDATDLTGLSGRVREVYRDGVLVAAGGATVEPGTVPPR
jgi:imidazolonepropionase-like amidohydrolase